MAVASPETQHLGLGAVSHVDELLIPPTFVNCANVAAQDYAVITHLEKKTVKFNVSKMSTNMI